MKMGGKSTLLMVLTEAFLVPEGKGMYINKNYY